MIKFDTVHKRFPNGTTAVHELTLQHAGGRRDRPRRIVRLRQDHHSPDDQPDGRSELRHHPRRRPGHPRSRTPPSCAGPSDTSSSSPGSSRTARSSTTSPRCRCCSAAAASGPGPGGRAAGDGRASADAGKRYPHQLSGGQQQRVGVARALAADPPVLLMDEPFGAVDPVVRTQLQDELLRLQQELNKTIVFVTHDIDEAVRLGDQIAVFRTGGHLVQCAPPAELLARPADDFVADFLGAERGLKLLSCRSQTPLGETYRPATRPRGRADWQLVVSTRRPQAGWTWQRSDGPRATPALPVRPLRDTDSLLSALNESIASPTGLVARVDATGVLTGVTSRDAIHARAGDAHTAAVAAPVPSDGSGRKGQRMTIDWSWIADHTERPHHPHRLPPPGRPVRRLPRPADLAPAGRRRPPGPPPARLPPRASRTSCSRSRRSRSSSSCCRCPASPAPPRSSA